MNIYEVVFSNITDPDRDRDAIFLVRAYDFQDAIDEVMRNGSREQCSAQPHSVFELGSESRARFNDPDQRILRGPYFECAYNFGWREWRKSDDAPEGVVTWQEVADEL
jgi:hypothetical protein